MTAQQSKKGRPKKIMDISLLAEADAVNEQAEEFNVATCHICGSTKNVASFRQKYVCIKCIQLAKNLN